MCDFEFGLKTAKGGFANERAICEKFNNRYITSRGYFGHSPDGKVADVSTR